MAKKKQKKRSADPSRAARSRAVVKKRGCRSCPALCCRELVLMITKPRSKEEIESLKWQLHYDTVSVFITNYRWHVMFKGKCMYLNRNNLCKIYDRRPQTCRRHNPPDCERYGSFWDVMIHTPEELEAYLQKEAARARRKRKR